MASSEKKKNYISYLTFLSTIAVVLWHINDGIYYVRPNVSWYIEVVIDAMVHFAIPAFFMITGANLLNFRERGDSVQTYAVKRIKKTFIPFIVWSCFFIIYYGHETLLVFVQEKHLIELLIYIVQCIFDYRYYTAFWFFIYLFGIYALIPLISLIPVEKRKIVFSVFFIVLYFPLYVLPFVLYFFNIDITRYGGSFYVLFVIAGYLIDNYEIEKKYRYASYVAGIISVVVYVVGTIKLSLGTGCLVEIFRIKDGFITSLFTIPLFILIKEISKSVSNANINMLVNRFNRYSFSIYILHIFVPKEILPLMGINIYSPDNNFIVIYPLSFVLTIVICIAIAYIIRKIPIVKYILP